MARSVRKGHKSVNSVSWGSLNQVETGTALLGWNMYEAGELSMMIDDSMSRPSWDRSYRCQIDAGGVHEKQVKTYLDVVALVIVTALSEETMSDHSGGIQHVHDRISVLHNSVLRHLGRLERSR